MTLLFVLYGGRSCGILIYDGWTSGIVVWGMSQSEFCRSRNTRFLSLNTIDSSIVGGRAELNSSIVGESAKLHYSIVSE